LDSNIGVVREILYEPDDPLKASHKVQVYCIIFLTARRQVAKIEQAKDDPVKRK
jgi:hypothetical protein